MDNQQIARILRETAQLLEIDGAIIGRYRSYEKAAELIASLHEPVEQLAKEPEKLKALPGIGDRMVEHLDEILKSGGSLSHHHGVGKLRREFLPRIMSQTALHWKRELKKTLDPANVFGAGNQGLDSR